MHRGRLDTATLSPEFNRVEEAYANGLHNDLDGHDDHDANSNDCFVTVAVVVIVLIPVGPVRTISTSESRG